MPCGEAKGPAVSRGGSCAKCESHGNTNIYLPRAQIAAQTPIVRYPAATFGQFAFAFRRSLPLAPLCPAPFLYEIALATAFSCAEQEGDDLGGMLGVFAILDV
jgi:hypothetical protein